MKHVVAIVWYSATSSQRGRMASVEKKRVLDKQRGANQRSEH